MNGIASIELVLGLDQALYLIMHEFGDLPVFFGVVGEKIIVESILWPVDLVKDTTKFNDEILKAYKLFASSIKASETFEH